jgi:membrane-associated phospholipid phosphatase
MAMLVAAWAPTILGQSVPSGMPDDRRMDLGRQFRARAEERRVLLEAQEARVALPPGLDNRVRQFLEESWTFQALAAQKTPVLGQLLIWNEVALQTTALDHTNPNPPGQAPPPYFAEQFGPPRTARVMAIVHIAMDEAVNAISRLNRSYKDIRATIIAGLDPAEQQQLRALQVAEGPAVQAAINRAIVESAYRSLVALYPNKKPLLDIAYELTLREFREPSSPAVRLGARVGGLAARAILDLRAGDRPADSDLTTASFPPGDPRRWHQDPVSQLTTALGGRWAEVTAPFLIGRADAYRDECLPGPPASGLPGFIAAYKQVKALGGDPNADPAFGNREPTPTSRTGSADPTRVIPPSADPNADQTFVGIFWAYDGSAYLCAPPRLYNMIATSVALRERPIDRVEDFAHYLAFLNVTMADAALVAWEGKFHFVFPRPVTYLREQAADNTPEGASNPRWTPLGGQATNAPGKSGNFSPPFPAYPSGHATFGGALFRAMALYFKAADPTFPEEGIAFDFVSDEYNGKNYGPGPGPPSQQPRAKVVTHFTSFKQAERLNADSRIYLGVHWIFDADDGIRLGNAVARDAVQKFIKP